MSYIHKFLRLRPGHLCCGAEGGGVEGKMGTLFCLPQLSNSENRMYFIEQSVGLVYNFQYLKRCCVASICALDPGPANVRAALVDWGH